MRAAAHHLAGSAARDSVLQALKITITDEDSIMRRLLIITLIAALASVTSGCETFGNGKLDKGEIWMIAGAIVVAGVIAAEEADNPDRQLRPPIHG